MKTKTTKTKKGAKSAANESTETVHSTCRTCGKPASELTGTNKARAMRVHEAACAKKAGKEKDVPQEAPARKDGRAGNTAKRATKVKAAKQAKAKSAKKSATNGVPKAFSKSAIVIDLISRKGGATLAEIMKATDWQKHSVRGFLSVLGKKGHSIVSTKTDAGERNYAKS